jgi:hypothetical protein
MTKERRTSEVRRSFSASIFRKILNRTIPTNFVKCATFTSLPKSPMIYWPEPVVEVFTDQHKEALNLLMEVPFLLNLRLPVGLRNDYRSNRGLDAA